MPDAVKEPETAQVDVDPEIAKSVIVELVKLDVELHDHGSSLVQLLRAYARNSAGIRF